MQYVNDDMDELFRRAAKDYPLHTGNPDWEKVKKALDEPPAAETAPSGRDNRRHLLWLLLLLPLPWLCNHYWGESGNGPGDSRTVREQQVLPAQGNSGDLAAKQRMEPAPQSSSEASISPILAPSSSIGTKNSTAAYRSRKEVKKAYSSDFMQDDHTGRSESEPTEVETSAPEPSQNVAAGSVTLADTKQPTTAPAQDSVQKDTTATIVAKTKPQAAPPRKKGFYAGFIGGVDATSIELQRVKKVGYDLGGVVGYAFNELWSVETGLLSSEKAYYSSGEHLYTAYLLPGTTLREANGDCRMLEVPLLVRYSFKSGKKGGWYASAGTSSYFMKKETYDYTYKYITTGQEVKRHWAYDTNSRHLFAAAQLSGGYSRSLGHGLELRAEPYVKLPLGKVGHYDLLLTSFGVHAGLIKKLR